MTLFAGSNTICGFTNRELPYFQNISTVKLLDRSSDCGGERTARVVNHLLKSQISIRFVRRQRLEGSFFDVPLNLVRCLNRLKVYGRPYIVTMQDKGACLIG